MHLGVAFLLVGAGELAPAHVAGEGLLACVCAHVRCQVVGAREAAHADAALEGLLACVDADVARQLVAAREASVARVHGARVGPLVHRRFARPGGVLALLDWQEFERAAADALLGVGRRENLESGDTALGGGRGGRAGERHGSG